MKGGTSGAGYITIYGPTNAGVDHERIRIIGAREDTTTSTGTLQLMTNNGSTLLTRLLINSAGNVGIGTTSMPGGGVGLILGESTAWTSISANTAGIQVKDVSGTGEVFAVDEGATATQLSPHDPITGEWIFYSENFKTGSVMRVNMEQLVKTVEEITGKKFMFESWEEGHKTTLESPTLIKAIQELKAEKDAQIEQLKVEIAALKAKVE